MLVDRFPLHLETSKDPLNVQIGPVEPVQRVAPQRGSFGVKGAILHL